MISYYVLIIGISVLSEQGILLIRRVWFRHQ